MSQNIQIAVRIRPQNKREKGQACLVKMNKNQITLKQPQNTIKNIDNGNFRSTFNHEREEKNFEFKRCYWSFDNQASPLIKNVDVYNDIGGQLIQNLFDGYNSTIFAYGQTGSGKSYTIEGQDDEKGILQHCLFDIFKKKKENDKNQIETNIYVSYLEIYNEDLRDLLDPSKKNLKIFSSTEGVMVQNLSRVLCENLNDVMSLLQEGKKIRVVGSHAMNIKSSRSHAIFMILLVQKNQKTVKMAKLNIVDLAGSERYSKTKSDEIRLQEASNINKSLTFLGLVIENLAINQTKGQNLHIPYRNSQLTHLLSESLYGNSKTFMIANISGSEENYEETLSTLRFAERVQCIKTTSKQNITDQEQKKNHALLQEIERMKQQIEILSNQAKQSKNQFQQDDKQIHDLYEMKDALEEQLKYNESLLDDANSVLEKERQQKVELETYRNQILKEAGIQIVSNGKNQQFDKDSPYLMNISDDPSLSGCLLFYLKVGLNSFGSSKECDINLKGLGIRKQHCKIKNENNQKLTIYLSQDARTLLNGAILDNNVSKPIQLQHLDRLYLGHDQAFKVIIPKSNKSSKVDANSINDDFIKGRLGQGTEQSKNLKKMIDDIRAKLTSAQFNRLIDQLQQALDNIDKANEITLFRYRKFPLKAHNIYFNLEILTSVTCNQKFNFEIGISVKNRDSEKSLFYWTYERFLSRLDDMLLWYSHENRGQDTQDDYNPWSQASYQKDLNKLNTKQLYKHYYGENKFVSEQIQALLKQKDNMIHEITRQCDKLNMKITEQDIELYADIYFRAFEKQEPTPIIERLKGIQNINHYIKIYMELSAELSYQQMIKYESQQQIDKILIAHKKQSSKQVSDNQSIYSTRASQSNQNDTQNTFFSLQMQNNQEQMIVPKQGQNDQLLQQYLFQQQLIPQQQQLISKLQQQNIKLKQQIESLMN